MNYTTEKTQGEQPKDTPTSMSQLLNKLSGGHSDLSLLDDRIWKILAKIEGAKPTTPSDGDTKKELYQDCYLGALQIEADKQSDIINRISIGITQIEKHL